MINKLNDIHNEWEKDSQINPNKLEEELIKTPKLHAKYLRILSGIKISIRKKQDQLDKLSLDKKNWLNGRMNKEEMDKRGWEYNPFGNLSKPLKGEMDKYVVVDPDISKLRSELEILESCHNAVLDIINNINWRPQTLRSIIDWRRFEAGN